MTPERMEQIGEILEKALALEKDERRKYLDDTCAGDLELRGEVESLLDSHERAGSQFLDVPAISLNDPRGSNERVAVRAGRSIGPYLILKEIGHGGMGEVFSAVRADGQYEKKVAIKLVRSGYDTEFILERFRNERQILASLDHPNIARLLDGGTTADDLPYLAMELVEGAPIDEYCDERKLSVTERLQLFREVCGAVQYAHQRLVIHRDIKPSNILVTSEGSPKLLDFGIAKLLDAAGSTEATFLRPMTPEYASPEQIRGETITTATDVYSLGVVLYQLLTGHSPYRVDARTPAKLAEAITSSEPEPPSTSVQHTETVSDSGARRELTPEIVSSTREASPLRLQKRLRGDLDFILLKALRKESARRYASVAQFAEDIRNHLEGLPVTARKGTWSYRAGKFMRRHKTGVAAAGLVVVTLIGGIVATLRQARIAEANRLRAEKRFNDVHKLANSLMFEVHDSIRQLPGATAARKLILERAQQYLDSLAQDAQSDPALLRDLAAAYSRLASVQGNPVDANLGDSPKSIGNYRRAVELLTVCASLEPSNRDTLRELARSYLNLSLALTRTTDKGGSKEATQKAFQIMEPLAQSYPGDQRIQFVLGTVYEQIGSRFVNENDLAHAKENYEKSLVIFQQLAKDGPPRPEYQTEISFAHKHIGSVLAVQKQLQPALEHYRAALAIDEASLSLDPGNAQTRYNITFTYGDTGWILNQQGDFDAALQYYGKALRIREALAAADPEDTRTRRGVANINNYIGMVYASKGDIVKSINSYKKALAIREALFQKDPANEGLRFEISDTQARIGRIYTTQAFRPHATSGEEVRFCLEAKPWLQKALPTYLERKAKGKLVGNDLNMPATLAQEIDRCSLTIARLSRPADSVSH
jgi:eukaryotic-like serine/threonine-protein kinase